MIYGSMKAFFTLFKLEKFFKVELFSNFISVRVVYVGTKGSFHIGELIVVSTSTSLTVKPVGY